MNVLNFFLSFHVRCRQMHADEQKLQQVLVAQVHYDRTAEEVAEILTAVVVKPNIDSQRLYDLIYVMEATAGIKM
jgi:hypothetical protein